MTELEIRRLIAEIQGDLSDLEQTRTVLNEAQAQFVERPPNLLESGGIALNMHDFYTGVENIFQRIALELGEGLPSGSDWHAQLLKNMSIDIPRVRPPVIAQETRNDLEEFLRFRHVVRHTYGHDLRWERIRALLESFDVAYSYLLRDIEEFVHFLESMTED